MPDLPQWHFKEMQKADMNADPIEGEFFSAEALDSVSDALVREAIQNSLDAGLPDTQTTVKVRLSSISPQAQEGIWKRYFQSLWPHLLGEKAGLRDVPGTDEPITTIVIEDFGTKGLGGDVRQFEDTEAVGGTRNDFYYFWRNIGRSTKATTERGRWGLGKTVFQAASRINAFFGLTRPASDGHGFLMGQSVLKIHKVQGKRCAPYGYFALFDSEEFALPVSRDVALESFSRDFGLSRGMESGLSVVIPYRDVDIRPDDLLKSVLNHYFFPILSRELAVEIEHPGGKHILTDQSLLKTLAESRFEDRARIRNLIQLAQWGVSVPEERTIKLKPPAPNKAPKMGEELFEKSVLDVLRRQFDEHQRVALKVPLFIRPTSSSEPRPTFFTMYLERDKDLDKAEDRFVRQGITITGVNSLKTKGVRVIVRVSDDPLSSFLGDSENPAHTEWQRLSPKFKKKYELGPSTLDFVKSSPRSVVEILSRPSEKLDRNLLNDIFSVPIESEEQPVKGNPKGSILKARGEGQDIELVGEGQHMSLSRIKTGFRLAGKKGTLASNSQIGVMLAYDVLRGDPFRRHESFDFETDKPPIRIEVNGARLRIAQKNVIYLDVDQSDFDLRVTGFDEERDLKVKVLPPTEGAEP